MRLVTKAVLAGLTTALLAVLVLGALAEDGATAADAEAGDDADGGGGDGDGAGVGSEEGSTAARGGFEDVRVRHDYVSGGVREWTFEVPPGAGPLDLSARVEGSGGDCVETPLNWRLEVVMPSGDTFVDLRSRGLSAGVGVVSGACDSSELEGRSLMPGTWTVRFAGRGPYVGHVEVVAP